MVQRSREIGIRVALARPRRDRARHATQAALGRVGGAGRRGDDLVAAPMLHSLFDDAAIRGCWLAVVLVGVVAGVASGCLPPRGGSIRRSPAGGATKRFSPDPEPLGQPALTFSSRSAASRNTATPSCGHCGGERRDTPPAQDAVHDQKLLAEGLIAEVEAPPGWMPWRYYWVTGAAGGCRREMRRMALLSAWAAAFAPHRPSCSTPERWPANVGSRRPRISAAAPSVSARALTHAASPVEVAVEVAPPNNVVAIVLRLCAPENVGPWIR